MTFEEPSARTRRRVRVEGVVQGVGFRPHVHRLATALELGGFVGNDERGVVLEVEGPAQSIEEFLRRLGDEAPPLAAVERVEAETITPFGDRAFAIVASRTTDRHEVLVAADAAICEDCLRELADPGDRRHRHPFINCTNCGPRYTVVVDVPYDRPTTTMAAFAMCADCRREYHDPTDRRFHAQPVCCPACGPRLRLLDDDGRVLDGEPIVATARLLRQGAVVAIKGLGGYHLAVDAADADAAAGLRARKHREDKPFAVMVADLDAARRLCEVSPSEAALLTDPARPIVLLHRRDEMRVAPAVAPGNRRLGLMLPYTPLHHLLAAELDRAIVLTSGNVSDEPIAYRDEDALERLSPIADAFLLHDREIHMRVDDSVAHVAAGRPGLLRRSRGYVPRPIHLAREVPRHVLGVGAELKNTVCLARDRHAFVSHHIGDLENYATFRSFLEAIEHLGRLFDVRPEVVAHDLHPEYLSTKHARDLEDLDGVELVGVQHHHAHIAACLTDNRHPGPVIGLALDGLGWGTDDTIWGGELLVADVSGFDRVGHLEPVTMPGGVQAIREPWRMALAHLDAAFDGAVPEDLEVVARNAGQWGDVLAVSRSGINSPVTSSAGRLFDAVSALLGIRDVTTFEGQAAIELEQHADPTETAGYPLDVTGDLPLRLPAGAMIRAVVDDLRAGVATGAVAARFHNAVVGLLVGACERVRVERGLSLVALSGGVFQNVLLLERLVARLERAGFDVLTHRQVPCNDGGVSLGQVAVAAARERGD